MNYTVPPLEEKPQDILLIATTIITLLLSGLDLILNAYIGHKKQDIRLTCSDCCLLDISGGEDDKVALPK